MNSKGRVDVCIVLTVLSDIEQRSCRRFEEHVELKRGSGPRIMVSIYLEGFVSAVELDHTQHITQANCHSRSDGSNRTHVSAEGDRVEAGRPQPWRGRHCLRWAYASMPACQHA